MSWKEGPRFSDWMLADEENSPTLMNINLLQP